MLHQPDILFLDEPTIGLDLLAKQLFRDLLVRVNEERGTTIFLTSHDVADVEQVAERVVVVNHGSVIYDDTVAVMRRTLLATKIIDVGLEADVLGRPWPERPGANGAKSGKHSFNGAEALALEGVTVLKHTANGAKLVVDTTAQSVRHVLDVVLELWPVSDISVVDPPLEDVIAEIYGAPRA
jgi:ABC-2 type transport system ATP-binding protein